MGMTHSGGAEGRKNVDTKQDNPKRVSLMSARKGKNATRLAGFCLEEYGWGFPAVVVVIKEDKG